MNCEADYERIPSENDVGSGWTAGWPHPPLSPAPLAQKYIRLKRVKVNGKGSQRDVRLQLGDILQLYINDEFFEQPREENAFLSVFCPPGHQIQR